VKQLAVPYLYGLSYCDQYGRWPWPEYGHGGLGLFEFYAGNERRLSKEQFDEVISSLRDETAHWRDYYKQLRKPSSKRACFCGSGKPFGKCHTRAWHGLRCLLAEMERLGLDPTALPK